MCLYHNIPLVIKANDKKNPQHKVRGNKSKILPFFSHPDYTVGVGITPISCEKFARGLYRR